MLKQRILTALALLAVLVPALFWLPDSSWAAMMALLAALAAWEWGAFLALPALPRRLLALGMLLLCVLAQFLMPQLVFALPTSPTPLLVYLPAVLFWSLGCPLWLRSKKPHLPVNRLPGVLLGLLIIFPTWLAMVQLRAWHLGGFIALLVAVWLADIGAYAAGRAFGRHKLAPTVSPGKTWEGVAGGALAVLLFALAIRENLLPSLSLLWLMPAALVYVAISVLGDLFESLLKRQVGLKDSSQLLPGHGGVLDRIDSLTSALPLAALVWMLWVQYAR